jgi:hypothetical protein
MDNKRKANEDDYNMNYNKRIKIDNDQNQDNIQNNYDFNLLPEITNIIQNNYMISMNYIVDIGKEINDEILQNYRSQLAYNMRTMNINQELLNEAQHLGIRSYDEILICINSLNVMVAFILYKYCSTCNTMVEVQYNDEIVQHNCVS